MKQVFYYAKKQEIFIYRYTLKGENQYIPLKANIRFHRHIIKNILKNLKLYPLTYGWNLVYTGEGRRKEDWLYSSDLVYTSTLIIRDY